jgi:hypothetical protein
MKRCMKCEGSFSRNANGVRGLDVMRSHDILLAHAVGVAAKRG